MSLPKNSYYYCLYMISFIVIPGLQIEASFCSFKYRFNQSIKSINIDSLYLAGINSAYNVTHVITLGH